MRVVHLLMQLSPSGMERMLISAAPYFRDAGSQHTIVAQGLYHPFAAALEQAGYKVVSIPSVKSRSGRRAWADVLRAERPDVVHIHPEEAFSAAVLTGRRAVPEARIVRTVHAFFPATGWWGVKRRAQLAVSERFVDVTVFLNEQMAAHESTFGRRGVVIGNWVDDRFLLSPRTAADVDILVVGNCDSVKRHEIVLTAALEAGWTVAHVGSEAGCSDDEGALLAALASRDLLVARGVADPLPWLARCAVFALPSRREGFSVALSEAIAMGCVCLTSAAPGILWAARYPLVTQIGGASAAEWHDALGKALSADITDEQRQGQRRMAAEELGAASGVRNYLRVYRSGTFLSH